jgi:hypothetical protein
VVRCRQLCRSRSREAAALRPIPACSGPFLPVPSRSVGQGNARRRSPRTQGSHPGPAKEASGTDAVGRARAREDASVLSEEGWRRVPAQEQNRPDCTLTQPPVGPTNAEDLQYPLGHPHSLAPVLDAGRASRTGSRFDVRFLAKARLLRCLQLGGSIGALMDAANSSNLASCALESSARW